MKHSESIDVLAGSLIAAKAKFSPALKHSVNPHFNSKYVDLAGALEATEAALNEQGITVLQSPEGNVAEKSVTITTRLLHKTGQWIEGELTLPASGTRGYDAQSVGSAITYGRRYAYMGMLGIAPEDDDGNGASADPNGKEIKRKSEKLDPADPGMTETLKKMVAKPPAKDLNGFRTIGVKNGQKFLDAAVAAGKSVQEINNFLGSLGCESPEEILVSQAPTAKDWVVSK